MQVRRLVKALQSVAASKWNALGLLFARVRISLAARVWIARSAELHIAKGVVLQGRLYIGNGSRVSIAPKSVIKGNIQVGSGCDVTIGECFKLIGANLIVDEESSVVFDRDCLIASAAPYQGIVKVDRGHLEAGANVNIRGGVLIREGHLSIGSNSFINAATEVRCEERITIGKYVFVAKAVDIFDTNTHSTDWLARQEEVDLGYPNATVRQQKPITAPIYIGDHVWIGKYAAVLKGSSIGARSIVGTRAVVTGSCPEDSLLVGNPATPRSLTKRDQPDRRTKETDRP